LLSVEKIIVFEILSVYWAFQFVQIFKVGCSKSDINESGLE